MGDLQPKKTEINGANGEPLGKHTFGKFYGMQPGAGYEGPIMDMGNAIKENCKRFHLSRVIDPEPYKDAMHGGQPHAKNFLKCGDGHAARCAGYGSMGIPP